MWLRSSHFSALSYSVTGIINLLPLISMPFMMATSSLSDQYAYRFFSTQALVDDQPWSMNSDSICIYLSYSVALLISPTVIQSDMSRQEPITLMVMHMTGISLCLFVSWSCLDSKFDMNSSDQGLNSILMFY